DLSRPCRYGAGRGARRSVQELYVSRNRRHVLARDRGDSSTAPRPRARRRRGVLAPPFSRSAALVRLDSRAARCASVGVMRAAIAVALAVVAIATLQCSRRQPGVAPSNDLLIVGYDREPDTLNRFSTHILEDIQTCVVEGLTTTDEKMNVVPLLAERVPTLENGGVAVRPDGRMDVTWTLRSGVRWHDGTPFTSADVRFTVDAINSPSYNPESTDGFDRITSVDTPDPLTAIVHYKEIYAPYDIQFIRGMLPRHLLEGRDIDRAQDYNRNPLGTGPYRVAEWKAGEYIRLERVEHYWRGGGLPKVKQLLFTFIPNTNTRINQLKSGEV